MPSAKQDGVDGLSASHKYRRFRDEPNVSAHPRRLLARVAVRGAITVPSVNGRPLVHLLHTRVRHDLSTAGCDLGPGEDYGD